MKSTSRIILKIKKADKKRLIRIGDYWGKNGYKYDKWDKVLSALNTRKLELEGIDINQPAF
jgi:hypothetical protein